MKPVPPWTWMPSVATSVPISVEKALATGVSNAARSSAALRAAASGARRARSSATAVAKQMARAARVSARIVSSMRRTSTWAMIGTDSVEAELALDAVGAQVIAGAEAAVGIEEELRYHEQRQSPGAFRAAGDAREHEM